MALIENEPWTTDQFMSWRAEWVYDQWMNFEIIEKILKFADLCGVTLELRRFSKKAWSWSWCCVVFFSHRLSADLRNIIMFKNPEKAHERSDAQLWKFRFLNHCILEQPQWHSCIGKERYFSLVINPWYQYKKCQLRHCPVWGKDKNAFLPSTVKIPVA